MFKYILKKYLMHLTSETANNVVNDYFNTMEKFFNGEIKSFIDKNQYSVNEIFFIIGKYNLIDQIKKCLTNIKLINYYEYVNLFYYAMIAGIYYKNDDIINIMVSNNFFCDENFKNVVEQLIKHNDREFIYLQTL